MLKVNVKKSGTNTKIVPITSVKLWKNNPRKNDAAVPKLAELLKIHGQKSPIVVWSKNNVIYKGNTTYKAMLLNGAKEIEVKYVDFPSEQAAIAYGIADNKSSEFSQWNEEILLNFMKSEKLQDTGFAASELNFLLSKLQGLKEDNPNDVFSLPKEQDGELKVLYKKLIVYFKDEKSFNDFCTKVNFNPKLTFSNESSYYPYVAKRKLLKVVV